MQRYVTGKEEPMRKFMREMEKNICKWMEKVKHDGTNRANEEGMEKKKDGNGGRKKKE